MPDTIIGSATVNVRWAGGAEAMMSLGANASEEESVSANVNGVVSRRRSGSGSEIVTVNATDPAAVERVRSGRKAHASRAIVGRT